MTDRELLEAAARAAGFFRMEYRDDTPYVSDAMSGRDFTAWNPLTDDGDALRLLVSLREDLALDAAAMLGVGNFASWKADPYAATRRAIVRAAAAMAPKEAA